MWELAKQIEAGNDYASVRDWKAGVKRSEKDEKAHCTFMLPICPFVICTHTSYIQIVHISCMYV